jgi:hypothetical protein
MAQFDVICSPSFWALTPNGMNKLMAMDDLVVPMIVYVGVLAHAHVHTQKAKMIWMDCCHAAAVCVCASSKTQQAK